MVGNHPPDQPIKISGKEVEEVGFEKVKKRLAELGELRIVLLDGLHVHRPLGEHVRLHEGSSSEGIRKQYSGMTDIREVCPRIVELDLGRNLFEDWREIASICTQLDHLRSLRVDGNRFSTCSFTDAEAECFKSIFGKVQSLSLEDTLLNWNDVVKIVSSFGSLLSLAISSNHFEQLDHFSIAQFPQSITRITLEYSDFTSLSDLSVLNNLRNLETLVLKNNAISDLNNSTDPIQFPQSLREVDLSHNDISSWSFISALHDIFPGMTSLRVAHNPLFQSLQTPDGRSLSADDGYMLTIARLSRLKILNYSPVSPKDRLNAESYYLSLIAQELSLTPAIDADTIITGHPRWMELCEEYGEPVIRRSGEKRLNPNSLEAQLIRFRFRLDEEAAVGIASSDRLYEVELPKSFSIYRVQGVVGKHFGLRPWTLRLVWETGEWDVSKPREQENFAEWDSEDDDGQESNLGNERVRRVVELVPGTREIGTWVEGSEVNIMAKVRI